MCYFGLLLSVRACREGWNTCMLKSTIILSLSNHCQIPVKESKAERPQLIKNKRPSDVE